MNTQAASHPAVELSAAALEEWEGHMEAVLRGIAHALNNRAASMSALMTLCTEPDYTPQATRDMLASEVDRLHQLVAVVRAIGAPKGGAEAFEPAEAARAALGVLGLHAALRDRALAINGSPAPVRVPRWMFVRALVVLAGRAAAAERRAPVSIDLGERDGWVEVTARGAASDRASPYLAEIAAALGGELLPGGAGFRLPTLAALRLREGR